MQDLLVLACLQSLLGYTLTSSNVTQRQWLQKHLDIGLESCIQTFLPASCPNYLYTSKFSDDYNAVLIVGALLNIWSTLNTSALDHTSQALSALKKRAF